MTASTNYLSMAEERIRFLQNAIIQRDAENQRLSAALTDLEMAVSDLMREENFQVSETLSCALDIARKTLAKGAA